MKKYNLFEQKWIKVIDEKNQTQSVSLDTFIKNCDQYIDIGFQRTEQNIAFLYFVMAVFYSHITPKNDSHWVELYNNKIYINEHIQIKNKLEELFYLIHPEYPFLQVTEEKIKKYDIKLKTIKKPASIMTNMPAESGASHVRHDYNEYSLSVNEVIIEMLTWNMFWGDKGTSTMFKPLFNASMVHTFIYGNNLYETILLNMVDEITLSELRIRNYKISDWYDFEPRKINGKTHKRYRPEEISIVQAYVWQTFFMKLKIDTNNDMITAIYSNGGSSIDVYKDNKGKEKSFRFPNPTFLRHRNIENEYEPIRYHDIFPAWTGYPFYFWNDISIPEIENIMVNKKGMKQKEKGKKINDNNYYRLPKYWYETSVTMEKYHDRLIEYREQTGKQFPKKYSFFIGGIALNDAKIETGFSQRFTMWNKLQENKSYILQIISYIRDAYKYEYRLRVSFTKYYCSDKDIKQKSKSFIVSQNLYFKNILPKYWDILDLEFRKRLYCMCEFDENSFEDWNKFCINTIHDIWKKNIYIALQHGTALNIARSKFALKGNVMSKEYVYNDAKTIMGILNNMSHVEIIKFKKPYNYLSGNGNMVLAKLLSASQKLKHLPIKTIYNVAYIYSKFKDMNSEKGIRNIGELMFKIGITENRLSNVLSANSDTIFEQVSHALSMGRSKNLKINLLNLINDLLNWESANIGLNWGIAYFNSQNSGK